MRELVFGARLNTLRRGKEGGGTSILNMFASSFLNIRRTKNIMVVTKVENGN